MLFRSGTFEKVVSNLTVSVEKVSKSARDEEKSSSSIQEDKLTKLDKPIKYNIIEFLLILIITQELANYSIFYQPSF